ncbi:hypothetical protein RclHR1_01450006 [Rhizophagus clarus]|uniref:Uncharacterized protein n=1 Tax=Rhizophagus clarus TaxID=94130 RepID=A0A2Z6R5G4_9GLOM|nr:hypothetical protein RclHR1_01450006 [Rhizophagus clarus]GES81016.1 hypothetical protein GLOIN_2v1511531 [Rhizophagus clarus]
MTANKIYFLILFLLVFLSNHVNAHCENITNALTTDGNWNDNDTFYAFSGGNLTFTLTSMPCGASNLSILVVSDNGGGNYTVRNFTSQDLNNVQDIGHNIIVEKHHQFRIQAKVVDFNDLNCSKPSFSGKLCYSKYVVDPDCEQRLAEAIKKCKSEKIITITVPIVTAIIGATGGIAGVLIKQYLDEKSNKPKP